MLSCGLAKAGIENNRKYTQMFNSHRTDINKHTDRQTDRQADIYSHRREGKVCMTSAKLCSDDTTRDMSYQIVLLGFARFLSLRF